MKRIYRRLFDSDIFKGFKPVPGDVAGWNDHGEHFARLLGEGARLVVEVGTWKGASALKLCEAAPNAEVVCIDTWLGAAEMWEDHEDAARYGSLRLKHGYPQLYFQFLSNMVAAGLEAQITPMPIPSTIALRLLKKWEARPDLIYIDGSHEFADVCVDIELALALGPGVICGDDWSWPGLRAAVEGKVPAVQHEGDFWWKSF